MARFLDCLRPRNVREAGLMLAYANDGALVSFADPAVQERLLNIVPLHDGDLSLLDICRKKITLAIDHIHFYNASLLRWDDLEDLIRDFHRRRA